MPIEIDLCSKTGINKATDDILLFIRWTYAINLLDKDLAVRKRQKRAQNLFTSHIHRRHWNDTDIASIKFHSTNTVDFMIPETLGNAIQALAIINIISWWEIMYVGVGVTLVFKMGCEKFRAINFKRQFLYKWLQRVSEMAVKWPLKTQNANCLLVNPAFYKPPLSHSLSLPVKRQTAKLTSLIKIRPNAVPIRIKIS